MNQGKKTVQPPYLKAGDKVALVSPAYWVPQEAILQAAETIISWGLQPVLGPHTNNLNVNAYAGTADERAADLMWALEDDSIKAIVCSRGGYGTIHLLNASQTHKGNVQLHQTGHFLGMTQMSAYLNLQIPFFFIIFAPNQLPS